uniref:leukocyte cell-derived chemotaxin 1-like n=1 Tax=Styela clava TaxID=7725 RepID=UPI00193AC6F8|nr:leukocyte cell-derived chemotaxin 1-like [Styela clava]
MLSNYSEGDSTNANSMKILMPMAQKRQHGGCGRKKKNDPSVFLYAALAIACLTIAGFCTFIANNWNSVELSTYYKVSFIANGRWQNDTIEYNKKDGHLRGREFQTGDSVFYWDLDTGYKAYPINQTGFNDNQTFCLISRRINPNNFDLDEDMVTKGLTDMVGNEQVAEIDKRQWRPSSKKISDTSFLPLAIKKRCKGLNMYIMEQHFVKGSREEADHLAEVAKEATKPKPDSHGVIPPGALYNPKANQDGKDCCVHCPKTYFYCQNVCIPLKTYAYPSHTLQNCERQVCTTVMPCYYWHGNTKTVKRP